jgi:hypothetical protein
MSDWKLVGIACAVVTVLLMAIPCAASDVLDQFGEGLTVGIVMPKLSARIERLAGDELRKFAALQKTNVRLFRSLDSPHSREKCQFEKNQRLSTWTPVMGEPTDPATELGMLTQEGLLGGDAQIFLMGVSAKYGKYKILKKMEGGKAKETPLYYTIVWTGRLDADNPDAQLCVALTALLALAWDAQKPIKLEEGTNRIWEEGSKTPPWEPYGSEAESGTLVVFSVDPDEMVKFTSTSVRPWSVHLDRNELKADLVRWSRTFWRIHMPMLEGPGDNPAKTALHRLGWGLSRDPGRPLVATLKRLDAADRAVECIPVVDNEAIIPLRLALQLLYDSDFVDDPRPTEVNGRLAQALVFRASNGLSVYFSWGYKLDKNADGEWELVETDPVNDRNFVTEIYVP